MSVVGIGFVDDTRLRDLNLLWRVFIYTCPWHLSVTGYCVASEISSEKNLKIISLGRPW